MDLNLTIIHTSTYIITELHTFLNDKTRYLPNFFKICQKFINDVTLSREICSKIRMSEL